MNVTVLAGGPSAERNVSLVSGNAVASGLQQAGHSVRVADISPDDLSALDAPADVVFPALHGAFGESGELQEILESRSIPFVGSDSAASRLGINKAATKVAWEQAGLPTPSWALLTLNSMDRLNDFEMPCIVKALDSGSSIDVYFCRTRESATEAARKILATHAGALVERFISGPELTVGFLNDEPLPPIRVVTTHEFFDFDAKYQDKSTEYRFETGLGAEVIERCTGLARDAYRAIGCRDLARLDLLLDGDLNAYLIEVNTMPGFTPKSLLPKAAERAGVGFNSLVDGLVRRAYERRAGAAVRSIAS